MGLFNKNKNGGFIDVIRCDEPSYLIWKWHPGGSEVGENKRENQIRWGSPIRVKEGEVAVFVYNQKNGVYQDYIEGPFDQTLKTKNLPILTSLLGLVYEGDSPFQAEVYYINLAKIIQIRFGVPYFDVFDPRFTDLSVPIAVRGTISFNMSDYKEFIKINRLINFSLDDFQKQVKDAIIRSVKDIVANAPFANDIPVIQIEKKTKLITELIEEELEERFYKDFGVKISGVDLSAIDIDKESEQYLTLKSVTQDVITATIKAQTDVKIKDLYGRQEVDLEHYKEGLRIKREEEQYGMHMHTQSTNINAYTVGVQGEVGIAGANALGNMGSNGSGDINLGGGNGGGVGLNPAEIMVGMTLGSVIGQNLVGTLNNIMPGQNNNVLTPPPIQNKVYYIAIDEKAVGPFDANGLKQLIIHGQLLKTTLLWTNGLTNWQEAQTIDGIKELFLDIPPIPNNK